MGGLAQNVQKPPPGKNVQKSQGQIFQECQGQIPKVKYFRNAKVKFPRSNGKLEKTGLNRKNGKWKNGKV